MESRNGRAIILIVGQIRGEDNEHERVGNGILTDKW